MRAHVLVASVLGLPPLPWARQHRPLAAGAAAVLQPSALGAAQHEVLLALRPCRQARRSAMDAWIPRNMSISWYAHFPTPWA